MAARITSVATVVTQIGAVVMRVGTIAMRAGMVVMRAETVVMRVGMVVMRAGMVVMRAAGRAVQAGLEVTCVAMAVVHGKTAAAQLPAGVMELPGALPQPAAWAAHELAEVSLGPRPVGPISAVVMRAGSAQPCRVSPHPGSP